MAITWSSCKTFQWGGVMSAGVEVTATTNSSNTSSVTVRIYLRVCSNSVGGFGGPINTLEVTGSNGWSDSNVSIPGGTVSPGSHQLIKTYTWSTSGSTSVTFNTRFRVPDVYEGALAWTNTASQTITTPAAPPPPTPPPGTPTNLSVTRVNDGQQTLSWTNGGDASGQNVRRRTGKAGPYQNIANISGSATTYTDNSTQPNYEYSYFIRAFNNGGSRSSSTVAIDTTPNPPGLPSAQRQGDGSITVTRGALPEHATHWEVWHGTSGVWDESRLALVPASSSTWSYSDPEPAPQHNFRTTAVTDDPVLTSTYSPAANVNSETPPGPPTNLRPNGDAVDRALPTKTLSWDHNALDTTTQRKFRLRWRLDGGSWSDTGEVTSGESSWDTSGMTSPGIVEWEVQTWGNHADPSPWSARASFPLTTAPAATITSPDPDEVITSPSISGSWTYFQADGSPQQSWETRVVNATTEAVVASGSGSGAAGTWTSAQVLQNLTDYRYEVRVQSAVGVWSGWDSVDFSVAFDPPNAPEVSATWVGDYGYALVTIDPGDDGVAPSTVTLTVERSIDGGPYVTLVENLDPASDYLDWTVPLVGEVSYRVTAWSDPPGFAQTTTVLMMSAAGSCEMWLSGGPTFAVAARLRYVMASDTSTGRERVLNRYAGRESPVETSGPLVDLELAFSVVHLPQRCIIPGAEEPGTSQASRRALEELFALPGPHLLRSGDHYFYGTLSNLQQGNLFHGEAGFTITRSDGGTLDQQAAIGAYTGQFLVEVRPGEYQVVGQVGVTETLPGEFGWSA